MHPVQPPQQWQAMRQDVPEVERVVEERQREQPLGGTRQAECRERAPASPSDQRRQRLDHRPFHQPNRCCSQSGDRQVAQVVACRRLDATAQRPASLEPEQGAACGKRRHGREPHPHAKPPGEANASRHAVARQPSAGRCNSLWIASRSSSILKGLRKTAVFSSSTLSIAAVSA